MQLPPASPVYVESALGPGPKMAMWLTAIFTCGVGTLAIWFTTRTYPRQATAAGIVLRSGKLIPWSGVRKVTRVQRIMNGRPLDEYLKLETDLGTVNVAPQSITNGAAMQEAILRNVPPTAL